MRPRLAVVLLAAGQSSRMDGPNKLLHPYRGRPLAEWALKLGADMPALAHVLVTGRDGDEIAALAGRAWKRVHNEAFTKGLSGSLRCGLAGAGDLDAALILLADMPDVAEATLRALVAAWTPNAYAVAPRRHNQRGNPVLLARRAIEDAAALTGDRGAGRLLDSAQDGVIFVDVEDDGVLRDLDTQRDFV
jgi:molybdenum cofactor cytidylyltransferase